MDAFLGISASKPILSQNNCKYHVHKIKDDKWNKCDALKFPILPQQKYHLEVVTNPIFCCELVFIIFSILCCNM